VQLLGHLQSTPDLDPELRESLADGLHAEVAAMNPENFIVRGRLEAVERFQQREAWQEISQTDQDLLQREVAGLPSQMESDDIESRLFDLTALRMQLALAEGDTATFEAQRKRVVDIAMLLEDKTTIPAVAAQVAYLTSIQESSFWEGIDLGAAAELSGLHPDIIVEFERGKLVERSGTFL